MVFDRDDALKRADRALRLGRVPEAIREYQTIIGHDPNDWKALNTLADLFLRVGDTDEAVRVFAQIADQLAREGFTARAAAFHKRILKVRPADDYALTQSAALATRQGLTAEARQHLTALAQSRAGRGDGAGAAGAWLQIAELEFRAGEVEAGRAAVAQALAAGAAVEAFVELGRHLGADVLHGARVCYETAAEAASLAGSPAQALSILEAWSDLDPGDEALLIRVIEASQMCGSEQAADRAQVRLIEAHVRAGRLAEARVVAEDLVARKPDDAEAGERLSQICRALGLDRPPPAGPLPGAVTTDGDRHPQPVVSAPVVEAVVQVPAAARQAEPEPAEIDLSELIDGLTSNAVWSPAPTGVSMPDPERPAPRNLDEVFKDFRDDVSKEAAAREAEDRYALGVTYRDMGMLDDARRELEMAVRDVRLRFRAAAALAAVALKQGRRDEAIEWYERAAEAPAPTLDAGRELMYELGRALEAGGERERALAVFMELRAEAGEFRDVAARVATLRRAVGGGSGTP